MSKFKTPKVTLGISAYNEQENIENILNSICGQKQENFQIDRIYVYSDGSTDKTDLIVRAFSQKEGKVALVSDGRRLGKTARVNQFFAGGRGDILVYLDGDVVLENEDSLGNAVDWFKDEKVNLVGFNKIPVPARNITEKLINTWFLIWYEIRKDLEDGHNIHNFSSCAFAVRGDFARKTKCPEGDFSLNKFLFFKAYKSERSCRFAKNSVVFYRSPDNVADRLKQFNRFTNVNKKIAEYFGDWTYGLYKVPRSAEVKGTITAFLKNPFWVPLALIFHYVIRSIPTKDEPLIKQGLWETVPSSKKVI